MNRPVRHPTLCQRVHTRRFRRWIFCADAILFGTGCGAEPTPRVEASRRDSSGIEIVESALPTWNAETAWRIAPEPSVRIGTFEGAPEEQLFEVTGAMKLSGDRVAVANSGSRELRFYDGDGRHLTSHGGHGEGPGEFQALSRPQRLGGDTIRVYDFPARRVSDLTPGGFVRSTTVGPAGGGANANYLGTTGDGSMIAQSLAFPDVEELADEEVIDEENAYWTYDAEGVAVREIATYPQGPRLLGVERSGGRVMSVSIMTAPLELGTAVAVTPGGLVAALADRYELHWLDTDGRLQRIVRYDAELIPATPAEIDRLIAESGGTPEEQGRTRERLEAIPLPEYLPTAQGIQIDRDGNAWVQQFQPRFLEGPRTWTVIGADGTWLGSVEFPHRFEATDIGSDYILGTWTDDLDIEYVLLYDLLKP